MNEKVTFGVGLTNECRIKVNTEIIEEVVEMQSKLTIMVSHLVLVYLLLTLSMLLFNKTCSVEHILRLLHISQKTERNLNVHKFYKPWF